jgi:hypothetical protein
VGRSERLIKPRDSWFSPKSIEVEPLVLTCGGRALDELEPIPGYRIQSNSEYRRVKQGRQSVWDKLHGREGNNPDQQLRCLNNV